MAPKTFAAALPVGVVVGADFELEVVMTDGLVIEGLDIAVVVITMDDGVEDSVCEILVVGLVGLFAPSTVIVESGGGNDVPTRVAVAEANGVAMPAEHVKTPSPTQIFWPLLLSPTQQMKLEMSFPLHPPTIEPEQQYPL
jgi:hypothetical protein